MKQLEFISHDSRSLRSPRWQCWQAHCLAESSLLACWRPPPQWALTWQTGSLGLPFTHRDLHDLTETKLSSQRPPPSNMIPLQWLGLLFGRCGETNILFIISGIRLKGTKQVASINKHLLMCASSAYVSVNFFDLVKSFILQFFSMQN